MKQSRSLMIRTPDRLLVLDVEGTLFDEGIRLPDTSYGSTMWQGIANALGKEAREQEQQTHDHWENGEYPNYLEWMRDTIRIHRRHGLTEETFRQLIESASYNPGVPETLEQLDRSHVEPVLVTGGFRGLARRAQADLGIFHAFAACEYIFDTDGQLSSYNLLPCDFEGKIDFIRLMLREYNLGEDDWYFVGDGDNDTKIAAAAPFAIGYQPDPELAEVVDTTIGTDGDFTELLDVIESAD